MQEELKKKITEEPPVNLTNLSYLLLDNYVVIDIDDGKEVKDIKNVRIVKLEQGDWQVRIMI